MISITTNPDHPLIQFTALSLAIENETNELQSVELFDACNSNHHLPEGIHILGAGDVSYERIRSSLLSDDFKISVIKLQSFMNIYHKDKRGLVEYTNKSIFGEKYTRPFFMVDPDSLEEPPEQKTTYDLDVLGADLNKQVKFTLMVLPKETITVTFFVLNSDFYEKNKERIIKESKLSDDERSKINSDYYNPILKKMHSKNDD